MIGTNRIRKFGLAMSVASLAAVAIACGSDSGTAADPTSTPTTEVALQVVTTIYPVTFFSEQVGGERAEVNTLISPGTDAHDFVPTASDIIAIREADVLVYNHPSFESWVEDALESVASDDLVVVLTADLEVEEDEHSDGDKHEGEDEHGDHDEHGHLDEHGHDHGGVDPHVWLDPIQAITQVRAIEQAFAQADASGADIYSANADALVASLVQLDGEFTNVLADCTQDHVVVSHEAYGHMAARYRFEQLALGGLAGEVEPGGGRIAAIADEMSELGVMHVMQEPIINFELADTVARETGADILQLHPLGYITVEDIDAGDDYFTIMRSNLDSLRVALGCV